MYFFFVHLLQFFVYVIPFTRNYSERGEQWKDGLSACMRCCVQDPEGIVFTDGCYWKCRIGYIESNGRCVTCAQYNERSGRYSVLTPVPSLTHLLPSFRRNVLAEGEETSALPADARTNSLVGYAVTQTGHAVGTRVAE